MPPLTFGAFGPNRRRVGGLRLGRVGRVVRLDRARAAEVGVRVVDAGVDDGDLDALAGEAESCQTCGTPRNGTLFALSRVNSGCRATATTFGSSRARRILARDLDLDPVVSGLELARTRPPFAAMPPLIASWRALSSALMRLRSACSATYRHPSTARQRRGRPRISSMTLTVRCRPWPPAARPGQPLRLGARSNSSPRVGPARRPPLAAATQCGDHYQ